MDKSHLLFVIWLVVSSMTSVSAEESTIIWMVYSEGVNCMVSVTGDLTQLLPQLINNPDDAVDPKFFCIDENLSPLGPLVHNLKVPEMVVNSYPEDDALVLWDLSPIYSTKNYFRGVVNVTGIAIDYQSQNIYFTVPTRLVIVQLGRSRPYYSILLDGRDNPRQIVVDPDEGYIFWAESAGLRRASLTGDQLTDITGEEVSEDVLLTIDTVDKRIYVLEGRNLKILAYDGTVNANSVVPDTLVGISIHQQYLFGTAADYPSILIINATSGELVGNISSNLNFKYAGITVRPTTAVSPTSPCETNNGGCSHICIHVPKNDRKCRCGVGFVLQDDGSSCKSEYLTDNFVLVTDAHANAIYQIDTTSGQIHGIPIEGIDYQFIEAIVYDPVEQNIIWMDTGNGQLRSLALIENSAEQIIYTFDNESLIIGIAFDQINRVVYYTDYYRFEIGRVYLNGTQDIVLSTASEGKPVQIVLDVFGGYVYWSSEGEPSKILRAQIPDGSGMTTIVETDLVYPSGLALSIPDSLLYWVDWLGKKLEKVNVDGSGREMLAVTQQGYTLALDNDYLYVLNEYDVSRFALSDMQESPFSMDIFLLLEGITLYSSSVSLKPAAKATTTPTTAMMTTRPGSRNEASAITGLIWLTWGLICLHHIIG